MSLQRDQWLQSVQVGLAKAAMGGQSIDNLGKPSSTIWRDTCAHLPAPSPNFSHERLN
jgi:hypothetical protein